MTGWKLAWLLVLTSAGAMAAPQPPEELFFGLAELRGRVRYSPPLTAVSGGYRLELVEVDQLGEGSNARQRLVLCCTPPPDADSTVGVVGEVYAADEQGHEIPVTGSQSLAAGAVTWLTFTIAGRTARLTAFAAAIGPPPRTAERLQQLDPSALGQATAWAETGVAAALTVLRREVSLLPLAAEAPPLYRGLDSTLASSGEPPAADPAHPYLTLRLATLGPLDDPSGWQLANLRLRAGEATVEDWRYRRLLWRPDWGGWLGAKGRDWEAPEGAGGPRRGVAIESLVPDGPGAAAGLQVGDVLVAANGRPVADALTLGEVVRTMAPGTRLRCEALRQGRRLDVLITLAGRELWPDLDEVEFREAWGQLAPLVPPERLGSAVLSLWDWQTRAPLAATVEPRAIQAVLTRTVPTGGTTFLLRHVPLEATP